MCSVVRCGVLCDLDVVVILGYADIYGSFLLVLVWGTVLGVMFYCVGVNVDLLVVFVGSQLRYHICILFQNVVWYRFMGCHHGC